MSKNLGFRGMGFIAFLLCWFVVLTMSSPGTASEIQAPPARARCAVCGMFVAKYGAWVAVVELHDRTLRYFDGAKDMFKFYLDPSRFEPENKQSDMVSFFVREYYELNHIDAKTAYFVLGSDVYGPMGNELIPFKTRQDALEFKKDHRGKKILQFQEVTSEILKGLDPF